MSDKLKINKSYAENYNKWRQKEELAKCKICVFQAYQWYNQVQIFGVTYVRNLGTTKVLKCLC